MTAASRLRALGEAAAAAGATAWTARLDVRHLRRLGRAPDGTTRHAARDRVYSLDACWPEGDAALRWRGPLDRALLPAALRAVRALAAPAVARPPAPPPGRHADGGPGAAGRWARALAALPPTAEAEVVRARVRSSSLGHDGRFETRVTVEAEAWVAVTARPGGRADVRAVAGDDPRALAAALALARRHARALAAGDAGAGRGTLLLEPYAVAQWLVASRAEAPPRCAPGRASPAGAWRVLRFEELAAGDRLRGVALLARRRGRAERYARARVTADRRALDDALADPSRRGRRVGAWRFFDVTAEGVALTVPGCAWGPP